MYKQTIAWVVEVVATEVRQEDVKVKAVVPVAVATG